jgi:hypothetical protein
MGDFGAYLNQIDWGLALLTAIVAVVVGLIVNRFLLAGTDEFIGLLPVLRSRLGLALLNRRKDVRTEPWVCAQCRSVNAGVDEHCYKGCGPRDELDLAAAVDASDSRRSGGATR